MKQIKFTIASDISTGNLNVVAQQSFPWPPLFWKAAYQVGEQCGCRKCHNCEIFELLTNYESEIWRVR